MTDFATIRSFEGQGLYSVTVKVETPDGEAQIAQSVLGPDVETVLKAVRAKHEPNPVLFIEITLALTGEHLLNANAF